MLLSLLSQCLSDWESQSPRETPPLRIPDMVELRSCVSQATDGRGRVSFQGFAAALFERFLQRTAPGREALSSVAGFAASQQQSSPTLPLSSASSSSASASASASPSTKGVVGAAAGGAGDASEGGSAHRRGPAPRRR